MTARHLSQSDLDRLVGDLVATGTRVIAPVRITESGEAGDARIEYRRVHRLADAILDGASDLPRASLKALFLPPTEPLVRWRLRHNEVLVDSVPTDFPPQVVVGARPCDAAAVEILDRVMGWDYRDELWFGRRAATTIIGLACEGGDRSCFCDAVGLAPDSTRGSDILLRPAADSDGFLAELLTPKGEALAAAHADLFKDSNSIQPQSNRRPRSSADSMAGIPTDLAPVRDWLGAHFTHPYWSTLALGCHGCGACAAVCPTCHCFDIVDEPEGYDRGARRRAWDTCQSGRFTVHASGHDPRPDQGARLRQRMMHKFHIYPKRFDGQILCTGCGRCARACPAGVDIGEVLSDLGRLAAAPAQKQG